MLVKFHYALSISFCRSDRWVKKSDYPSAICAEVIRLLTVERERQNVSENRLATLAGLSQSFMARLKRNKHVPNLDSLVRISVALNIDLGDIVSQAVSNSQKPKTSTKRKSA